MISFLRKITPKFLISLYHLKLSFLGALMYGFPSRKIKVIGVTGTSGKTTVVDLASLVFEDLALMSSIKFKIRDKEEENRMKMTMPGRFAIQKFLRKAVREKCKYFILEVTSEGIKQHRHRFIKFDAVIFTNLSLEHIESHGGFENYRKEKLKLFKATKNIHVINSDDENSKYFSALPCKKLITFGVSSGDVKGADLKVLSSGISFNVDNTLFNLGLLGSFNIMNTLAVISLAKAYNISLEQCSLALSKAKGVPGRMEIIAKEPFSVVVDYAITPVALEKVYKSLGSNLICVLGSCGGGRDKWKRPVFGKIAVQYCKQVIITNEDPYNEDPIQIIEDVANGTEGKAMKILDRREAIRKALQLAVPGDTVIITGKGCEPWMCLDGGKKTPWDDRKIAKEELSVLK